jgi:hypothetical protein
MLRVIGIETRRTRPIRPTQTVRGLREGASRLGQVVHRLRHDTSESGATDIHKLLLISKLTRA